MISKPTLCVGRCLERTSPNDTDPQLSVYWRGWASKENLTTFSDNLAQAWGKVVVFPESGAEELPVPISHFDRLLHRLSNSGSLYCAFRSSTPVRNLELWASLQPRARLDNLTPEVGILGTATDLLSSSFYTILRDLLRSTSDLERLNEEELEMMMAVVHFLTREPVHTEHA